MITQLHRLCAFMVLALASFSAPALAMPYDAGHARVDLVAEQQSVQPGSTVRAALTLELDEHWHVYWKNPGDSGLPAEIYWDDDTNVEIGEFQWPVPHPQPLDILMNYGYEERLVLPFDVTIPEDASGAIELRGSAQYLICKDICIPEEAPIQLLLTVGDSAEPGQHSEMFAWADDRMPTPLEGQAVIDRSAAPKWKLSIQDDAVRTAFDRDITGARFFPNDHQILHPPVQPVELGSDGVTITLEEAEGFGTDGTFSGVLALDFADGRRVGYELTAAPGGVLPGTTGVDYGIGSDASEAEEETVLPAASSGNNGDGSGQGPGGPAATSETAPAGLSKLLGVFALALLGGAVLNLMPCVLPVLFIKARSFLSLAGHDDDAKIRQHGVFYVLGVLACFLAIGALLAALRAGGEVVGLGFQLQYPAVVAGLALLMFVLGLNMMGMFDFGSSLMGVGSGLAGKGGNAGAFFTGVLAAFVGAPCIGPFLGAATGFAFTQPVYVLLLVFFFLGLGMALPFGILSFFPKLFSYLPKPGPWMERLKQFFAFPLFLTAIWLIWVLGQLAGIDAVALTAIGAVLLTLAIWLMTSAPQRGVSRDVVIGFGVFVLLSGLALPVGRIAYASSEEMAVVQTLVDKSTYEDVWSPETLDKYQEDGRAVFVDFTASWCVTCQLNKSTTFKTDQVKSFFKEQDVVFLVADWTRKDKIIGEELERHGRVGVPLYLYYPKGQEEPVILPQILSPDLVIDTINKHSS